MFCRFACLLSWPVTASSDHFSPQSVRTAVAGQSGTSSGTYTNTALPLYFQCYHFVSMTCQHLQLHPRAGQRKVSSSTTKSGRQWFRGCVARHGELARVLTVIPCLFPLSLIALTCERAGEGPASDSYSMSSTCRLDTATTRRD